MKVEDVPADELARCDSCGKRIKKRHHELILVDEESSQVVGHYHALPDFGCLQATEKYTATPGSPMVTEWIHPERCGERLQRCDLGAGDTRKKEKRR